ncbi:sugar transferase [Daejeonella oryzae]|uniref:sugar transferase n=1 Tax=Daejeonella oryzae TaxID=1122943 RepID=UPI0004177C44|nr:sugar transferase [Daejeonella oryzae]
MYRNFFKRSIDLLFSFLLLIIIFPIFLVIVIILVFYYKGNPFFTQKRPGKNEKIFRLFKLKSMIDKVDENGLMLPDSERITSMGKFIRKTSIDEIPQLFNVLKGDMSFIGPRPLLVSYLEYYIDREKIRHSVRPGITGLAQVSGRNNLKLPERLELDVQYVENLSFVNDCKIVFKTIQNVLSAKDITVITASKTLKDYRQESMGLKSSTKNIE